MKTKLTILCVAALMCLMLTLPASAGNIGPNTGGGSGSGVSSGDPCPFGGSPAYCNAGSNGYSTDAWTINFGFSVTDSFTFGGGTLTSASIITWNAPGDVLTGLDWSIATNPFGGSGATAAVTGTTDLGTNQFGYDIQAASFNLGGGVSLGAGTYWLTLANATTPSGDPIYWDENSGASSAQENTIGTIPSESFAVYGSGGGGTPEPGTLVLGGSGLLLLAGALRRKLSR